MNEQITAIAALLLEINGKEKYTAFFDFSGHVRTFSIRIYSKKGWFPMNPKRKDEY